MIDEFHNGRIEVMVKSIEASDVMRQVSIAQVFIWNSLKLYNLLWGLFATLRRVVSASGRFCFAIFWPCSFRIFVEIIS